MKNMDVRQYAKSNAVFLWQVAQAMGISEPTMSRRLRMELPKQDKQRFFCIIDKIAEQNAASEQNSIKQN